MLLVFDRGGKELARIDRAVDVEGLLRALQTR
jgi:hypothetical protein